MPPNTWVSEISNWPTSQLYNDCEEEAERLSERLLESYHEWPYNFSNLLVQTKRKLSPDLCDFFGHWLGYDFNAVRIHSDTRAAEIAYRMSASAFTLGGNIVFGANLYSPQTLAGLKLLAHELIHVIQQGYVRRQKQGKYTIKMQIPLCVQRQVSPQRIYEEVCPPGSQPVSYPSESLIGTAYGKWLGLMYLKERKPDPYCLVDFWVYYRGQWGNATIFNLARGGGDPGVSLAFVNRKVDSTWRWPSRTDILDAQRDEVYEIKPVAEYAEGVTKLQGYISELNDTATTTGPIFTAPRSRLWHGGSWDPSRYPLMIPGIQGSVCLIHAWMDPQEQGLILYDIVCCEPNQSQEHLDLVPTKVASVSKPILDSQPRFALQLDKTLKAHLPYAPRGSVYAFLVTPRVFETYVLGPMAREQDRQLERAYGIRPGPAMQKFVLDLFILGHILSGPVTDALFISSGYMSPDEIARMWGAQVLAGIAGETVILGAAAVGTLLVGAEISTVAAVNVSVKAAAEGVLAAEGAGASLVATETLTVATTAARAASSLVIGGASEAVVAGSTVPPWMLGGLSGGASSGMGTGLGVVGIIVTAFVAGDAQASTTSGAPQPANTAGADELYLVPIELLAPKTEEIGLNAEVTFGGEHYFIIGLTSATETS